MSSRALCLSSMRKRHERSLTIILYRSMLCKPKCGLKAMSWQDFSWSSPSLWIASPYASVYLLNHSTRRVDLRDESSILAP